jgi:putative aldouronate transport system permease protein
VSNSTAPRSKAGAATEPENASVVPADTTGAGDGSAKKRTARKRTRKPKERSAAAPAHQLPFGLRWRRDRTLLLMTVPAVVLILVFNYLPILGNVVAFEDYDPYISENGVVAILHSTWIGAEHFQSLFGDPAFWHAVSNTLILFVLQLLLYFPVPIALALLINSVVRPRIRAVSQAILYLPHFFSWVLVIAVFQQLLGGAGLLSQLLRQHGFDGIDLMTDPDTFKFLVTAQGVWKDAGWGIIVFLAALASVDQEQYEAAAMDGAGRWRRMWHVTLPALRPVIALLLVLRVGDALTVGFEQILLQRDAVGPDASEVLDTFVWWYGVRNQDFGYAAAAGLVKGVVSIALVLAANKVAHLMGEQGVYRK